MAVLVLAEINQTHILPATLNTIAAAKKIDSTVDLLLIGHNLQSHCAEAQQIESVKTVYVVDHATYAHALAENIAPLLVSLAGKYDALLAPATSFGKNIMPRLAALLDVQQISDIIAIISPDSFVRPIYAGNALATVQSLDKIKVVTVRSTGFSPVSASGGQASLQPLDPIMMTPHVQFVRQELVQSSRPELTAASIVISGGRGMQNGENFKLLEAIADKLGAAIGASRAAVDAGFVSNDHQVGQTGKIVAPKLYIAVGISGAIQHMAGMKESKVIVAINKDADAPIFQIADYGLVADLFEALPELASAL
jgi:electron transfer flavoprotein alpha subunit